MVAAFLRFELPAEAAALAAAAQAVGLTDPTQPVLVNGAGEPAHHTNGETGEIAAVAQVSAPKRGPGRPRKTVAAEAVPPASEPEPEPVPVPAAPVAEPEPVPVPTAPAAEPEPTPAASGEAENSLRSSVAFEAQRVSRLISIPAMRGVLQGVGGEAVISVQDVPAEHLVATLAALRAVQ